MNHLEIQTSQGAVFVVGRIHAALRPTLLVIPGAFPKIDFKHELPDVFPGANVIVARLPGFQMSPLFRVATAESFSTAFDELLSALTPRSPVVVYGLSTGCLVALGMKHPHIVRHVTEEPFFHTENLWPLIDDFQPRLRREPENDAMQAFLWNFLGYGADEVKDRDYSHLPPRISVPTDVLVGELALEPRRELPTWPSLTSDADRALLKANPHVTMHIAPPGTGHGLVHSPAAMKMAKQLCHKALLHAAKAVDATSA
jgi:pimeloyl-ACP methyl ester carboxylesterase